MRVRGFGTNKEIKRQAHPGHFSAGLYSPGDTAIVLSVSFDLYQGVRIADLIVLECPLE